MIDIESRVVTCNIRKEIGIVHLLHKYGQLARSNLTMAVTNYEKTKIQQTVPLSKH